MVPQFAVSCARSSCVKYQREVPQHTQGRGGGAVKTKTRAVMGIMATGRMRACGGTLACNTLGQLNIQR